MRIIPLRKLLLRSAVVCLLAGCAEEVSTSVFPGPADTQTYESTTEEDVLAHFDSIDQREEACLAGDDSVAIEDSDVDFTTISHLRELLRAAVTAFPDDLSSFDIELRVARSNNFFVRSGFSAGSVFQSATRRNYRIIVSRNYFTNLPPDDGITAIFVHELMHISDYTERTGAQLLGFVLDYVLSPRGYVPPYERATDLRAMEAGYARGLLAFRRWQEATLTEAQLVIKRRNYYTVSEIEVWLAEHGG